VRELLGERAALFREQAGAREITVNARAQWDPAPQFDRSQIGRALDNLILNAIQNSSDGTRIDLSADKDETGLKFSVSDNGNGISPDIREHLFEPFATGRADGTGLGLAIVREIAEAHGGRIRVEHRANGTTFSLELPAGIAP
jgi:signal transduction histidine kinase